MRAQEQQELSDAFCRCASNKEWEVDFLIASITKDALISAWSFVRFSAIHIENVNY